MPITPPPCSEDPECWFDRARRTQALATCLECPVRRWCAQEALRTDARCGMWAGIWIEGPRGDIAHYLRAIASDQPSANVQIGEIATAPTTSDEHRATLPRLRSGRLSRPRSVSSAVLARSSGNCEVLADGCRFTADVHVSRIVEISAGEATSADAVYAACGPCATTFVPSLDQDEARRFGFVVDSFARTSHTPFYWRGARWVTFDRWGRLRDADPGCPSRARVLRRDDLARELATLPR